MKMRVFAAMAVAVSLAFGTARLMAQGNSDVHVPDSSIEKPGERGHKAHTNHVISLRGGQPDRGHGAPPPSDPPGKSPAQIRQAYVLPSTGGAGTIAIVDAFHYATALNDFNTFSTQFGLPTQSGNSATNPNNSVFRVVYASGFQPQVNCGWGQEAALDIEWAHAMAPGAKIVLVEAASNSFNDLFNAVLFAEGLPNVVQISMSWGGGEFSGESDYDTSVFGGNVTYFAASGDTGGKTIYPGVSPNVVSAGGTSLTLANGQWTETGWSGSGGGPATFESRPTFQNNISSIVGSQRGVPDFSFDADPNTGVAVYDSTRCQGLQGWMVFGGTSVSSPALAGIVNLAQSNKGPGELGFVYDNISTSNFNDVVGGSAGSFTAVGGWDFVTGIGSNKGLGGK
jgi:kumamolisin